MPPSLPIRPPVPHGTLSGRRVRQASLGTAGERETIGSVATRALTEDSAEMEFLTDDPGGAGRHMPASDVRRAGTTLRPLRLRSC
jgi:hypothetical protein